MPAITRTASTAAFDSTRLLTRCRYPPRGPAIPNPQRDDRTWANSLAQCELALTAMDPHDVVRQVRAYIDATLAQDAHALGIAHAAAALGLSVRTLIRRLRVRDTSFQELRDTARRNLALQLLDRPGTTVSEITHALGFSDPGNFSRAVQALVRCARPRQYRRQRHRTGTAGDPPRHAAGDAQPSKPIENTDSRSWREYALNAIIVSVCSMPSTCTIFCVTEVGDLLVVAHADNRDDVVRAADGVDLRNLVDVRERLGDLVDFSPASFESGRLH